MICEVLEITDKMASMISANEPREKVLEEAINSYGFRSMLKVGLEKALQGITTLDEVLRVTRS